MKTAALYIRVSTDEQAEKGFSQRHQEEVLRKYCELKGILIFKTYFEDHSAKTFKRPVWNRLLVDLRKNKRQADLVLFTKWDRFSRNAGDAYTMINTLRRFGVEPQAIEQPLDLSVPENKMMLAFYLAAPEVENDRRSLNIFNGIRRAKKEGRWPAAAPVGYANYIDDKGRKSIKPKEPHATIMRWAFEEVRRKKFNLSQIFTEAASRGLSCKRNNFFNILHNPIYCGKVLVPKHQDEEEYLAEGQHEALISEALYYEVQDILNGNKKGTTFASDEQFPLRGFLQCPKCTRILTASASKGRKDYYYYYHCSNACGTRFKADEVNTEFTKELKNYNPKINFKDFYFEMIRRAFREKATGVQDGRKLLMGQIQELYNKINNARELTLSGDFDISDFKQVKLTCEKQISALEAQLPEINLATRNIDETLNVALSNLYKAHNEYRMFNTTKKRTVIGAFYPAKLMYDGVQHRTARPNEIILNISLINKKLRAKKN